LGAVHYLWLAKGFQIEPLAYLAAIIMLLGLRLVPTRTRQQTSA
jgi:sulfoxide reductase heme-binding subunit YedZ